MPVSEQQFNFSITNFDDAVTYISDMIGSDFQKAIELTSLILEDPSKYTGQQASAAAVKLSIYRLMIGQASQYWKRKETDVKHPHNRLMKDAYHVMYESLLEVINCLKAAARNEREIVTSG
jgi:hypothetical protein